MPMFIITGSRITAAISPALSAKAWRTASASLNGTTIVVSHSAFGTPLEVGCVVYHPVGVSPTLCRRSSTSASGTTENRTESWCPW